MANEDARKVLAEEILADARKRAEAALSAARTEADKLIAAARATAQTEAAAIRHESAELARKRSQMMLRAVEQEVDRLALHAREEVLQQVIDQAREELQRFSGEPYGRSVRQLAMESLRQAPGDSFVVKAAGLSATEGSALVAELTAALRGEGRTVSLQFSEDAGAPRGVIVESPDGAVRWDNTYDVRLQRLREDIRRNIAPVLFEET